MAKKANDDQILRYLEDHTYDETQAEFGISRMTISRIKKRNKVKLMPEKIRVAIVGLGNAASALVQGTVFYKARGKNVGLLHPTLAGYHISDIEIVAAIDISQDKVGKPIGEAIKANEFPVSVKVDNDTKVLMGEIKDGVIEETELLIKPSKNSADNLVAELKNVNAEILLCLLPSGAIDAVRFYADLALEAKLAFINATPSDIANDKDYVAKFKTAGLPLIGDDLQDQWGSTILHKLILKQMLNQGMDIKESYALDVGGGPESLNTIHRSRYLKRAIKTKSVSDALGVDAPIVAGTSDYVPHLGNGRNTLLWIVGNGFLDNEVIMDIKIQSIDGPNGGAILADVIRATRIALHQGIGGVVNPISAYGFKNPSVKSQTPEEALENLGKFVLGKR